jgi:hypothetical protein
MPGKDQPRSRPPAPGPSAAEAVARPRAADPAQPQPLPLQPGRLIVGRFSPAALLSLQRTVGNRAVLRLLSQQPAARASAPPTDAASKSSAGSPAGDGTAEREPAHGSGTSREPPEAGSGAARVDRSAAVSRSNAAAAAKPVRAPIVSNRPSGPGGALQRLTGYEAEANVPIYGTFTADAVKAALTEKGKGHWSDEIALFIGGGLKYGFNYGTEPSGHYTLSADHNVLMGLHRKLVQRLILAGYLKDGYQHRSMSNLEYITPPRDELGPGAAPIIEADANAVRKHHAATVKAATGGRTAKVPPPAVEIFTGIPVKELEYWVHPRDMPMIAPVLTELEAAIDDQLYMQETTGVLPQDVPALYEQAGEDFRHDADGRMSRCIREILARSPAIARDAYARARAAAEEWPDAFDTHKPALEGYLTLMAGYLLADNLSMTSMLARGSTEKNFFPFFPKAKMVDFMRALPAEVRPGDESADAWNGVMERLHGASTPFGPDYWARRYDVRREKDDGVFFPLGQLDDLKELVEGKDLQPSDSKALGLDEPHPAVKGATGQMGIPLEDRYVKKKLAGPVTGETLEKFMSTRFGRAIARNLQHVPEEEREEVEEAVGKPPSLPDMLALRTARTGRLIEKVGEVGAYNVGIDEEQQKEQTDDLLMQRLFADEELQKQLEKVKAIVDPEEREVALTKLERQALEAYEALNARYVAFTNLDREEDKALTFAGAREEALKEALGDFARGISKLREVTPDWIADSAVRQRVERRMANAELKAAEVKTLARRLGEVTERDAAEPGAVAEILVALEKGSAEYLADSELIRQSYGAARKKSWFRRHLPKILAGVAAVVIVGGILLLVLL